MARRKLAGMRCLVTGASSGIGRALTEQLIAAEATVVAVARRRNRLEELAGQFAAAGCGTRFHYLVGDITSADTRHAAVELCRSKMGGLDCLINNAGIGALGPFVDAAAERFRRVMEVNLFAPAELTRDVTPLLRQGRAPIIVNISSVLGHRAVPGKSEYCASKFALHGWSDALRAELSRDGIDVLLVSPSTTAGEFFEQAEGALRHRPRLGAKPMSATRVAQYTLKAIRAGKHEIILTLGGKLLVWIDRLCPPLADRLTAWLG